MIFAKAKTEAACMMHDGIRRARQSGLVGVLGGTRDIKPRRKQRLAYQAKRMDKLARLPGFVFPVSPRSAFLGWKQCESNEFSSGEEESFGSESRVNSRACIYFTTDVHPEVFGTTVAWN